MPEGDTIRRLAERIARRFAGQHVGRTIVRHPRLVGLDLAGRTLTSTDAHGKHLLVRFDDEVTIHSHLRMQGSWRLGPRAVEPEWRRRLELRLDTGWMAAVDVPVLDVLRTVDEPLVVGHLGPDLCGPVAPDAAVVAARLADDPDRPLAGALLDQRLVAGFGNLYAVEVPFVAGVSPHQPVGSIAGLDALVAIGTALIRTNADRGPQNTTGRRLAVADHWIYGARGRPCPVCATPLAGVAAEASPWRRVSTWCPSCQRVEPERAVDEARARRLLALHPAIRRLAVRAPS